LWDTIEIEPNKVKNHNGNNNPRNSVIYGIPS
jgi:hypothetical protein